MIEENDDWKMVCLIPPPKAGKDKSKWIKIVEMPGFCQPAFGESDYLNAIQTEVYPVAFKQS